MIDEKTGEMTGGMKDHMGDRFLDALERLLGQLERGRFLPDLLTLAFATTNNGWGTVAVPNLIVPPRSGNAIFVTGLWISGNAAAAKFALGEGTSTGDAETFTPSLSSGAFPAGSLFTNNTSVTSLTTARPGYVFRTDAGKGVMLNNIDNTTLFGLVQFFAADYSTGEMVDPSGKYLRFED